MKLVYKDESYHTEVFTTIKPVKGRQNGFKIVINGGPQFEIEPSGSLDSVFLRKSKDNQLLGLLTTDGELVRKPSENIDKLHFLSKLNLIPKKPATSRPSNGAPEIFDDR